MYEQQTNIGLEALLLEDVIVLDIRKFEGRKEKD